MVVLRPYQEAALAALDTHWGDGGGAALIDMATATGKSLVLAETIRRAFARDRNFRATVAAHVRELVEQDIDALLAVWPDAPYGICCDGLGRRDHDQPIIFGTVQTLYRDAALLGRRDLLAVDEVQCVPRDGDGMYLSLIDTLRGTNPDLRMMGASATCFRLDTGYLHRGDGALFEKIVYSYSISDGIKDKWLSPLRSKATLATIDVRGVGTRAGEFVAGELERAANVTDVVEGAVAEIVEQGENRKSWIGFCCGVDHAYAVRDAVRRHGISCETVVAETPSEERGALFAAFRAGAIRCLTGVNIFSVGFDIPQVDLIALLRPTLSTGLYVQQCLDEQTEILTTCGWCRYDAVNLGDSVAAFDSVTGLIEWCPAENKIVRPLSAGEDMYAIAGPHLDIRVTGGHELLVKGHSENCVRWHKQSAAQVAARASMFCIPISGQLNDGIQNASISDDELRFVGWFLTDGCLDKGSRVVAISQSSAKPAHCDEIRRVLAACGFKFGEHRLVRRDWTAGYPDLIRFHVSRGAPRERNKDKRGWQALEPWLDKDLPPIFDSLSARQLTVLLGAMNLGNGANGHKPNGWTRQTLDVTTGIREQQADRLQALCVQRGLRCNKAVHTPPSIRSTPGFGGTKPLYWVHIKPKTVATIAGTSDPDGAVGNKKPYTRSRFSAVASHAGELVWCVSNRLGTLVTRRNGKVAILGNCGRGTRLAPGKHDALVLDFAGNIRRHGPVDSIHVNGRTSASPGDVLTKVCPACREENLLAARVCSCCGHVFFSEPRIPKHAAVADDAAILSSGEPDWRPVRHSEFRVYRKTGNPGAPPTLRVDHLSGFTSYSEYIAFESANAGARYYASAWWRAMGGRGPAPQQVAEAYARRDELGAAIAVTVERDGQYWRIAKRQVRFPNGSTIEADSRYRIRRVAA
jgi:superfamily II DNA or RNA helicase